MTTQTKEEVLEAIKNDTEFDCAKYYDDIEKDGIAFIRKMNVKDKGNMARFFVSKGWIDKPRIDAMTKCLTDAFGNDIETPEQKDDAPLTPRATSKRAAPKAASKAASKRTAGTEAPLTNKTKSARSTRGAPTASFKLGRNGIVCEDMYDADKDTSDCEFEKPDDSEDAVKIILQTFYTGDKLDAYLNAYEKMQSEIDSFIKKKKITVDEQADKSIFTRAVSDKSILNYKVLQTVEKATKKGTKTETKKVPTKVDVKDPVYKAISAYEEFGKEKDEKGKLIKIEPNVADSLHIFDTQAINSINAFDYNWVVGLKGKKGEGFNTGIVRERTHYRYKLIGSNTVPVEDLFDYICSNEGPTKEVLDDMFMIEPYTEMRQNADFAKKCYETFNNRERICDYNVLTPEIRKNQWLAAMSNIEQIELESRNDWQKRWLNVLKSEFMYYIFMYNIPEADWLKKPLKLLLTDERTLRMAMYELYPISFLFTPFMAGESTVVPKSTNKSQSRQNSIEYFKTLEAAPDSAFLYYLLNKSDTDTYNKTLQVIEGLVESYFERSSEKKRKSSSSDT